MIKDCQMKVIDFKNKDRHMKDVSSMIVKIKISANMIKEVLIGWMMRWAFAHNASCLEKHQMLIMLKA